MDQMFQLQRQIQGLHQELNTLNQVAGQLQRSESNHAMELQRLSQSENMASQQLQTIQQICSRLSQDVNMLSGITQQITPQLTTMPLTSGQWGGSMYSGQIGTGQYSPSQYGTFGAQFGGNRSDEFARNQQISAMAANRYGAGFSGNDYADNQYINNMVSQGMLGSQRNLGTSNYGVSSFGTGIGQTGFSSNIAGNYPIQPAHPVSYLGTPTQFGGGSFTGSVYSPSYGSSFSTSGQLGSGLASSAMMGMGGQNIGAYSNF